MRENSLYIIFIILIYFCSIKSNIHIITYSTNIPILHIEFILIILPILLITQTLLNIIPNINRLIIIKLLTILPPTRYILLNPLPIPLDNNSKFLQHTIIISRSMQLDNPLMCRHLADLEPLRHVQLSLTV